jgi:SAM-dependent methyltransferase
VSRDPAVERAHFDALVAARGPIYWADRTAAGARRREIRAELLAARAGVGAEGRVLEIGCAIGDYTEALASQTDALLVSVDVAPAAAALARSRLPHRVAVATADVERLPFAGASFDAVVGNAVLHHLRLDRALPELLRVLRPGGRFCFSEPNMLNPHVFVEKNVPWVGRLLDDSPGETAFVRWRLAATLARAGLADVSVRPFDFLYPAVPAALVPAVERLGRWLERLPGMREVAGSLLVTARKPAR